MRRQVWTRLSFLLSAGFLAAIPASAQTVTDGDTIKLSGTTYRLWGIDAPETRQSCADGWPAGANASAALTELMRGRTVTCEGITRDRFGRTVAVCRADGRDLGADMVAAGLAWNFTRYNGDYDAQEAEARLQKLGVHAHDCAVAWEWRAEQRR